MSGRSAWDPASDSPRPSARPRQSSISAVVCHRSPSRRHHHGHQRSSRPTKEQFALEQFRMFQIRMLGEYRKNPVEWCRQKEEDIVKYRKAELMVLRKKKKAVEHQVAFQHMKMATLHDGYRDFLKQTESLKYAKSLFKISNVGHDDEVKAGNAQNALPEYEKQQLWKWRREMEIAPWNDSYRRWMTELERQKQLVDSRRNVVDALEQQLTELKICKKSAHLRRRVGKRKVGERLFDDIPLVPDTDSEGAKSSCRSSVTDDADFWEDLVATTNESDGAASADGISETDHVDSKDQTLKIEADWSYFGDYEESELAMDQVESKDDNENIYVQYGTFDF